MEQNPQEIVKLVKGQPDWHLTVNDNYDVIKQKIDDATGEVQREEFEALESEVADLGSNIVDMGATIADQNTTINGQTALIQGVESRIATAEPKITLAQTTATNAATAAATADTKAVNAQTTATAANTTANTAVTNTTILQNINKFIYICKRDTANTLTDGGGHLAVSNLRAYNNNGFWVTFTARNTTYYSGSFDYVFGVHRIDNVCVASYSYSDYSSFTMKLTGSGTGATLASILLTTNQKDLFAPVTSGPYSAGLARGVRTAGPIAINYSSSTGSFILSLNSAWIDGNPANSTIGGTGTGGWSAITYTPAKVITNINATGITLTFANYTSKFVTSAIT